MDLAALIRDVPDFPVPGVLFKDVTTLLGDPDGFRAAVDALRDHYADRNDIDLVAAIEARGFLFAAPLAYLMRAGLVPIRKPGKLPASTTSIEYSLEYGSNTLEMHTDAIVPGQKVLVVDDVLATGGSAKAAVELIERLGGEVIGVAFLAELTFLNGIAKLHGYDVYSVIRY
ncbi:MAG: adenine phosphoribosyltransferase [Chloroflexi bacterium]|nr:adenine phosphoribosyltransferase [Chloroflexota bacterium]